MRAARSGMLVVLLAGCAAGRPGTSKPDAPEPVRVAPLASISKVGDVHVWKSKPQERYRLKVSADKVRLGSGWDPDRFKLQLLSDDRKLLVEKKFVSTYGIFRIDAIDLTGDGREEFVFLTGFGRGTSVRKETLAVYRREGAALAPVLEVHVSAYFDSGLRWWYEAQYLDLDGDGTIDLRLVLTCDPPNTAWKGWRKNLEKVIPRAAIKEYRWDPTRKKMVLVRQVPRRPFKRPRR